MAIQIKKKQSRDELFSFRIQFEDKEQLNREIEVALERLNRGLKSDERKIYKNEIILEAIRVGLPIVKKK